MVVLNRNHLKYCFMNINYIFSLTITIKFSIPTVLSGLFIVLFCWIINYRGLTTDLPIETGNFTIINSYLITFFTNFIARNEATNTTIFMKCSYFLSFKSQQGPRKIKNFNLDSCIVIIILYKNFFLSIPKFPDFP